MIYDHPTITILPIDSFSLIENFNSFILGINLKFTETFFKEYNLEISKNILVVDIDKRNLFYHSPSLNTETQTIILNQLDQNFILPNESLVTIDFPKNPKFKISEKLKNYIREIKANIGHKEDRESFIRNTTHFFYSFMVSILQEYSKYIISTDKEIENVNQILNSNSNFNSPTHKKLSIYIQL